MMIRNPYVKQKSAPPPPVSSAARGSSSMASTTSTGNAKRPQRPWEEAATATTAHALNNNNNNNNRESGADHAKRSGITSNINNNNNLQRPLQGNENRNVNHQPFRPSFQTAAAAATSAAAAAATSAATANDDFDPFDGCDIDWDAAVKQADDSSIAIAVKTTTTTTSSTVLNHQNQPSMSGVNRPYSNTSSSQPHMLGTTASNTTTTTTTRENPYKKSTQTSTIPSTAGTNDCKASSSSSTIQNSPSSCSNINTMNHHHNRQPWSSPRPSTSYSNCIVRQPGLVHAAVTNTATFNNSNTNNSAVAASSASHGVVPPTTTTAVVVVPPAASSSFFRASSSSSLTAPHQSISTRPPRAPTITAAAAAAPAPPGPLLCGSDANNAALASLRPKTWTTSSTSSSTAAAAAVGPKRPTNNMMNNNNNNNTAGVKPISFFSSPSTNQQQQQHPGQQQKVQQQQPPTLPLPPNQVGLPAPLQFDPAEILPVTGDGLQKDLVRHADVSGTLLNGWTLFSHQKRAVLKGLRMRRMILALDMGLGKTLTASVWAKAFHKTMKAHIVVICPISVQHEWQRTFEKAIGLVVQDLNQKKSSKKKNADKEDGTTTSASPAAPRPAVTIYSWAKVPGVESLNLDKTTNQKFVVIADECHNIQSMQAARTTATLKLVLDSNCVGVMMLSGTPMKNGKPSNLFPLLRAVKNPLGKHQRAFEARFCEGREVQYGRGSRPVWEAKGSANLQQLKALADPHILHLPKEIIKDLPPKTRIVEHVPVSSRNHQKHQIALHELARIVAATKQTRSNNSNNNANSNTNNNTDNSGDPVMGALSKLRKACSMAKVDAAVSRAKQILQKEAAVVIFTDFQEVAESICNQLVQGGWKGELLTGKTPSEKRQGMVDNFQSGISPVFVGAFGAAGAGITLHAAHTIILVDRPWTPGDTFQAEDRVRRIGQKHAVKCIWLSAFELDKQMDAMIQHKDQTAKSVLDSSSAPGPASSSSSSWVTAGAPAPKISIDQLLKSLIPDNSPCARLVQTSMLKFSQADEQG